MFISQAQEYSSALEGQKGSRRKKLCAGEAPEGESLELGGEERRETESLDVAEVGVGVKSSDRPWCLSKALPGTLAKLRPVKALMATHGTVLVLFSLR